MELSSEQIEEKREAIFPPTGRNVTQDPRLPSSSTTTATAAEPPNTTTHDASEEEVVDGEEKGEKGASKEEGINQTHDDDDRSTPSSPKALEETQPEHSPELAETVEGEKNIEKEDQKDADGGSGSSDHQNSLAEKKADTTPEVGESRGKTSEDQRNEEVMEERVNKEEDSTPSRAYPPLAENQEENFASPLPEPKQPTEGVIVPSTNQIVSFNSPPSPRGDPIDFPSPDRGAYPYPDPHRAPHELFTSEGKPGRSRFHNDAEDDDDGAERTTGGGPGVGWNPNGRGMRGFDPSVNNDGSPQRRGGRNMIDAGDPNRSGGAQGASTRGDDEFGAELLESYSFDEPSSHDNNRRPRKHHSRRAAAGRESPSSARGRKTNNDQRGVMMDDTFDPNFDGYPDDEYDEGLERVIQQLQTYNDILDGVFGRKEALRAQRKKGPTGATAQDKTRPSKAVHGPWWNLVDGEGNPVASQRSVVAYGGDFDEDDLLWRQAMPDVSAPGPRLAEPGKQRSVKEQLLVEEEDEAGKQKKQRNDLFSLSPDSDYEERRSSKKERKYLRIPSELLDGGDEAATDQAIVVDPALAAAEDAVMPVTFVPPAIGGGGRPGGQSPEKKKKKEADEDGSESDEKNQVVVVDKEAESSSRWKEDRFFGRRRKTGEAVSKTKDSSSSAVPISAPTPNHLDDISDVVAISDTGSEGGGGGNNYSVSRNNNARRRSQQRQQQNMTRNSTPGGNHSGRSSPAPAFPLPRSTSQGGAPAITARSLSGGGAAVTKTYHDQKNRYSSEGSGDDDNQQQLQQGPSAPSSIARKLISPFASPIRREGVPTTIEGGRSVERNNPHRGNSLDTTVTSTQGGDTPRVKGMVGYPPQGMEHIHFHEESVDGGEEEDVAASVGGCRLSYGGSGVEKTSIKAVTHTSPPQKRDPYAVEDTLRWKKPEVDDFLPPKQQPQQQGQERPTTVEEGDISSHRRLAVPPPAAALAAPAAEEETAEEMTPGKYRNMYAQRNLNPPWALSEESYRHVGERGSTNGKNVKKRKASSHLQQQGDISSSENRQHQQLRALSGDPQEESRDPHHDQQDEWASVRSALRNSQNNNMTTTTTQQRPALVDFPSQQHGVVTFASPESDTRATQGGSTPLPKTSGNNIGVSPILPSQQHHHQNSNHHPHQGQTLEEEATPVARREALRVEQKALELQKSLSLLHHHDDEDGHQHQHMPHQGGVLVPSHPQTPASHLTTPMAHYDAPQLRAGGGGMQFEEAIDDNTSASSGQRRKRTPSPQQQESARNPQHTTSLEPFQADPGVRRRSEEQQEREDSRRRDEAPSRKAAPSSSAGSLPRTAVGGSQPANAATTISSSRPAPSQSVPPGQRIGSLPSSAGGYTGGTHLNTFLSPITPPPPPRTLSGSGGANNSFTPTPSKQKQVATARGGNIAVQENAFGGAAPSESPIWDPRIHGREEGSGVALPSGSGSENVAAPHGAEAPFIHHEEAAVDAASQQWAPVPNRTLGATRLGRALSPGTGFS